MNPGEQRVHELIRNFRVESRPEARERTLGAMQVAADVAASAAPTDTNTKRRTLMIKRIVRIAAVVAVAVGAAAVGFHLIYSGPKVAFAQVRQQILQARTMAWTMTTTFEAPMPGGKRTMTMTARCLFKEPGLMRQVQQQEDKVVSILTADLKQGRALLVMPGQKRAQVIDLGNTSDLATLGTGNVNMMNSLKEAIAGAERSLGERVIDGRETVGFRVRAPQSAQPVDMDVWVDADTGDIVRIEVNTADVAVAMSDFAFNEEYDDALFGVEPPEGYTVLRTEMKMDELSEKDLVDGLRFLAEHNHNVFPEQPSITPEIVRSLMKEIKDEFQGAKLSKEEARARSEARGLELQKLVMRLLMFINTQARDSWRYNGSGVMLGDAKTPLCWYKPHGSEVYRVIYGNLATANVAEQDLPEMPEAAPEKPGATKQPPGTPYAP